MDPSDDNSRRGPEAQLRNDAKWREYMLELFTDAFEKICVNRLDAAKNAQVLLRSNFPPNPLRFPKTARVPMPPRVPRGIGLPLPRQYPPRIAVGTGLISLMYHFVKKIVVKAIKFVDRCGKVIVVAFVVYTILKMLQQIRTRGEILEAIPEKVALIVCDDVVAHDVSRKTLLHILKNPRFFAVIPTCVMEGILIGMESVSLSISAKAHAAFLFIFDLLRFGMGKVENAPQPEDPENLEWGWDSSGEADPERDLWPLPVYEDRILNCARTHLDREPGDHVFIITSSEHIRNKATLLDIRCDIPPVLLNWSLA